MAIVVVTANNNRVNAADAVTNWGNDGGGGGISTEVDITYQNNISMSRKISTTRIGRSYDPGAGAVDMTVTDRRHYLMKITTTNPGVLLSRTAAGTGPALGIKMGSANNAYYEYYIAGAENYPARGGWLLIPVSPNVSGYRDANTGTPTLTAIDYWSVLSDFSVGSKAENVAIDAIDVGAGLHLVGGDGGDTDGVFDDFVSFDEGTATGRYGYVFTQGSITFVNGALRIGRNTTPTAVATVFQDTGKVVVWQNGYAETGFHSLFIDLGGTGTDVDLTSCTLISEGELNNTVGGLGYTTTEDTRTVLEVTNTVGTFDLTTCNIQNFSDVILNSACTVDGCDISTAAMTQGSAEITNSIIRTTALTSIATLTDPTFGLSDLHDTEFVQAGAGHAVEITTAGSYTLTNMTWTGYGATASDSAAIDITETTGTVTLNISGGNTPTYKTAGATVVIVNSVSITVTTRRADTATDIEGARVYLEADTGGDLPYQDSVTIARSATTATVSHTAHGLQDASQVNIVGADQSDYNGAKTITVIDANSYSYTVANSPTTPATGTITCTAIVLNDLTDVNGDVSNTGFDYTNPQPIIGWARRGTATPRYKTAPIQGTIAATVGFSTTVFMVSDE